MNISSGKCQAKNRSVRNEVKHYHACLRLVWNNLLYVGIYNWNTARPGENSL